MIEKKLVGDWPPEAEAKAKPRFRPRDRDFLYRRRVE
jgi:hypothetical protein